MLKMKYELTCDGCGKTEPQQGIPAYFEPWWKPPFPNLPDGWKEVGDLHFCPAHSLAVRVYDDELGGKVYYDAPKGTHGIIR